MMEARRGAEVTRVPVFPPTTPDERQAYDASIVRSLVIAHQERQASGLDIDDDGHLIRPEAA